MTKYDVAKAIGDVSDNLIMESMEYSPKVVAFDSDEGRYFMKTKKRMNKMAVVFAATFLLASLSCIAYAKDIGGIQRIVQIWLHGDQTNAVFSVENGSYTLDYKDSDGNEVHQGGGGVAFNADGSERALTEKELWEHINRPEVELNDDGRVMCYFLDQTMDITEKFDGNICYLQLDIEGHTEYMTIKRFDDGIRYAMSPHSYVQPKELDY